MSVPAWFETQRAKKEIKFINDSYYKYKSLIKRTKRLDKNTIREQAGKVDIKNMFIIRMNWNFLENTLR
ncbi:MAG: hypothetical protein IPJ13_03065 [Saprospiraceae bacterium]|nr:hypothetical protein [Saprospiraceae bacterium]